MTQKTAKQVAEQTGISEKLIRAVIRQLGGTDSLRDIASHGAAGGYAGFTYYTDTVAFYKRNRAEIRTLAMRMSDDFGQDVISMIAGFNCLKESTEEGKRQLQDEIGRALYGKVGEKETNVANALAWFAAGEVARAFENE